MIIYLPTGKQLANTNLQSSSVPRSSEVPVKTVHVMGSKKEVWDVTGPDHHGAPTVVYGAHLEPQVSNHYRPVEQLRSYGGPFKVILSFLNDFSIFRSIGCWKKDYPAWFASENPARHCQDPILTSGGLGWRDKRSSCSCYLLATEPTSYQPVMLISRGINGRVDSTVHESRS